MSEMNTNGGFITTPEQDFDTAAFQGSMQQVLQENVGSYVLVEFLIGTGNLETRQGILYSVASQFLVLFDDINLRYIVCDIFAVKFVTFLLVGYRPGQVPSAALLQEEEAIRQEAANQGSPSSGAPEGDTRGDAAPTFARAAAPVMTPSQAAYTYAVRRGPAARKNQ